MMCKSCCHARLLLTATLGLLIPMSGQAASLKQVTGWTGGVNLPSDVTMSIYVPDKLASRPPIVTIIHYCGGSAQDVFRQAKDIVAAADQYGFILVFPAQTHQGGCWDVSSKKTQTHDGGGDTHAIAQMVRYTISEYKANPDRVYATGDSSGGMMTQLLMAVYPDIFKAGSSFAGVPAGCSNVFDGSGLCGLPAQTAQQWGDRVRAMYPGYSGPRPRVQLFHGDNDATIPYKNQAEAIKEWTNVLGLSATPTTTITTGITLGKHQGKREQWKDACGYVVLDAFTSLGGDHGPSDCLFIGQYVLPFLGLDSQAAVNAAVDPQIAQCGGGGGTGGSAGSGGAGGASGMGGSVSSGGGGAAGRTSSGGVTGGDTAAGGSVIVGGRTTTGGSTSSGGGGANPSSSSSSHPVLGGSTGGNSNPEGGSQSTGGQPTGGISSIRFSSSISSSSSPGSEGGHSAGAPGSSSLSGSSIQGGSSGGSNIRSDSASISKSSGGGCVFGTAPPARGSTLLLVLTLGMAIGLLRRRRR